MAKLLFHNRFGAHPGKREALLQNLLRAGMMMETISGCRLYLVSTLPSDPISVWVTEVWDSEEAHTESLKVRGVQAIIQQTVPLIAEMPGNSPRLALMGGKGVRD
jgi:quinol monooxygenase YgiN